MTDVKTDNVDAFFEKLNQAADVVTQKLVAVAPEAAEAMLSLVQAKGIFDLTVSVVILGFSLVMATISASSFKKAFVEDSDCFANEVYVAISAISAAFCLVSFIVGGARITNFYYWVAAFYPEGAIAMKALQAVGISL